jgi:hypothetical protein
MNKLKEIFYDPEKGLGNLQSFFKKVKQEDPNMKYKEVKDFYDKQEVNQIMRPQIKPKEFNSVTAKMPRDIFEIDYMIYDRYTIDGYKYIFCCVDVYSRYAQCVATTNLELSTIITTMKSIFGSMGYPNVIKADNQFSKKDFVDFCSKYDIKCIFSNPYEIYKNPIVERFNRTLALKLQKIRLTSNNRRWYKYLNLAVNNYNNTYHKTIQNTPKSVFDGDKYNEQIINRVPVIYQIGDMVRIVIKKKVFDKGDVITYSPEVYRIVDINGNRFKLNDIDQLYKAYEIRKVADIVYKPDSKEDKEQKEKVDDLIKSTKIKKIDVDASNIIDQKRTRKEVNYKE